MTCLDCFVWGSADYASIIKLHTRNPCKQQMIPSISRRITGDITETFMVFDNLFLSALQLKLQLGKYYQPIYYSINSISYYKRSSYEHEYTRKKRINPRHKSLLSPWVCPSNVLIVQRPFSQLFFNRYLSANTLFHCKNNGK